MQSVLIVGVDGQIGSALAVHLEREGYIVFGTTRRKERLNARTAFLDLREMHDQHELPAVDAVVICAGMTSIANCEETLDDCRLINVENTIGIVDKYAKDGAFVVFLSSSAVFDGKQPFCKTSDNPNPVSSYGKFKLAVEAHTLNNIRSNVAVLRLTKVITQDAPFIRSWELAAREGRDILAYANRLFSPLPIHEVLDSISLLIRGKKEGLYQLGGREEISYFEFAKRHFLSDVRARARVMPQLDPSLASEGLHHNSLATHLPTKEPQYNDLLDTKRITMGLMSGHAYLNDPKRLTFTLSRYKFVSKMFSGFNDVLEIGCADAFGTPIVMKEVGNLVACDFDAAFMDDVRRTHPFFEQIQFKFHNFVEAPLPHKFDGIYALDVLEHIEKKDEDAFLGNIASSLRGDGVCVIGMPSLESQTYASEISRRGHINCKSGADLKRVMSRYFDRVFLFSMNDEVVHTGFELMAHYLIAMGVGTKE